MALFGSGSAQMLEPGSSVTESNAEVPDASGRPAGSYSLTRDATAESLQIVSAGGIKADGLIESTEGGFRFPDGTVQTTAAGTASTAGGSTAAAAGLGNGAERMATELGRAHPNVVIVDEAGGGYPTISGALESITDAGPANPYLVYLAPGVYREKVRMKAHVALEGAGEHQTSIVSAGGGERTATVLGAPSSALRNVSVENTGGGEHSIAIRSAGGSFKLSSVRAVARNGDRTSVAIVSDAGSMTLRRVIATAMGGAEATGVRISGSAQISLTHGALRAAGASKQNIGLSSIGGPGSKLELRDLELEAAGVARFNTGILCEGIGELFFDGVRVKASGAELINEGVVLGPAVRLDAAPARITGLWAVATGGDVARSLVLEARSVLVRSSHVMAEGARDSTGLWISDGVAKAGRHTIRVLDSSIVASGQTVWSEAADASVEIGHSTLEGGTVFSERGRIACAATIDEDWRFHPQGCP